MNNDVTNKAPSFISKTVRRRTIRPSPTINQLSNLRGSAFDLAQANMDAVLTDPNRGTGRGAMTLNSG